MKNIQSAYELQNAEQVISEHDDFTPERYRQLFSLFTANARKVLDVGCNTGRGGIVLKSLNGELAITGLDCVEQRLAALPAEYSNKIYGLSTDIPADDRSFDIVVAAEFLEHLYPADVDRTLCEMQRILAIGGRLLLTTPNPYYLQNKLFHKTTYGVSHLTQHFPKTLAFRMKMHGFANVRICGSGRVSKYIGQHIPILALYGSYIAYGDKY
jgi:ubiquinone/menaquinone biosynthesis C-methylase UbiE